MRKLVTTNIGVLGPFSNIQTLDDRFICDDTDLQISVIGSATIEEWSGAIPDLTPYEFKLERCHSLRKAEYPPISDYIDGIVKGDQAQVQAYIDACLAVKAKYPKPE